jgi:hypothetical protein
MQVGELEVMLKLLDVTRRQLHDSKVRTHAKFNSIVELCA